MKLIKDLSLIIGSKLNAKIGLIFILLLTWGQPSLAAPYKVGDSVSPVLLETLEIDPNKITIVDFFASWCVSCRKELPLLNSMQLDSEKYELLGICTDKKIKQGLEFQKKLGLEFRIYNDNKQKTIKEFSPVGMPAMYFVYQGKVIAIHIGAIKKVDQVVQKELAHLSEQVGLR
ncbi:MAG: TlpA family protein disulfide reductase [Saccharospirillaceae bacterium]|nr:TlpA family protein disulfide reductase [Pseudomonadales bacterium]NRB81423.1 TlpA family protein disulfide reductase [Saccharospirillaceae bacterium]